MKCSALASLPRSTLHRQTLRWTMVLAIMACSAAMAQVDATIDQIDRAARAGHVAEAQQMMEPMLRAHPGNAKAHYVEAELLARQGRMAQARAELGTAEHLAPGLPFAHADAVQGLRRELGAVAPVGSASLSPLRSLAPHESSRWGIAIAVLGGALLAWILVRLGRPQPGGGTQGSDWDA